MKIKAGWELPVLTDEIKYSAGFVCIESNSDKDLLIKCHIDKKCQYEHP